MKKKLISAVAVVAIAVGLAGCTAGASGGSSSGKKVTLTLLTFETPNLTAKYWDDIIKKTDAAVPGVTIKKLVVPSAEDRDKYARQLDSTGSLPDIMVAINPTGLAEAGKLASFSKSELKQWVDPTANSFSGKIYQLPTNTQTWQAYYNKDLFTKAGISSPPKAWDELISDSQKLKDAGISPFVVGGGPDTLGPRWLFQPLVSNDVYAKDPTFLTDLTKGKTDFSNPDFVKALTQLKELSDKGFLDQAALSTGYADTQAAFLAGAGAMYVMGSWFAAAPSDAQQSTFGVFPVPTDSGKLVVPAYTGGGLSVSSKAPDVSKAKQWALEFSKLNADGGAKYDGLFIALKGYTPPSGLPALYTKTLGIYQSALKTGTVTTDFGSEAGVPALPSGFITKADAALLDLLSGRASVDDTVKVLNDQYTALSK